MITVENEQRLIRTLYEQNNWWVTSSIPKTHSKPFKRRDFYVLKDRITEKEITAIVGPRQVGKTTIMYQLIEHLMKEKKVNPKRILYLSFDYPYLTTITKTPINDILKIYSTQVIREPIQKLTDPIYVFLDEICKLDDWSRVLKGWYDLKYPIKFTISDSSSSDVLRGSSESLVGRITLFVMLSMEFVDVIRYHEKKLDVNAINQQLRNAFNLSIIQEDPNIFYESVKNAHVSLINYEELCKIYLQGYLLKDGYPELLGIDSPVKCTEKLRNYLTLTLYKDLVRIFDIRDPKALEELVTLLAEETSQRADYTNLSNTLSIKSDTLTRYLDYLESVFLISRSEYYSKSRSSRIRKSKKIYLTNVGLRNALVGMLSDALLRDSAELGKVVETIVNGHCRRLKFHLEPGIEPKLYYWKTSRGEEVDIVMELFRKPIPIEVKYRNNIATRELKGLTEFLKEYKSSFGIVVTKDRLGLKKNIVYVPLWLFLLMC